MERNLPSLNAIRSFEAAARYGSFTRAAEALNVTQGAISRMVIALEEELQTPLFHRRARQLELTAAGKTYQSHISEALDRIDFATRSIKNADNGRVLSIVTLPTFALRWLIPRLSTFEQKNPGILVDVTTADGMAAFDNARADIEIRYGTGSWPNLEATRLMDEHVSAFCSPDFLYENKGLRKPLDLLKHRLLQHTTRSSAWTDFGEACGVRISPPKDTPAFEHFFMLLEATASGMGVALLPTFLAQDDVRKGRLVQPFRQTVKTKGAYYLLHSKAVSNSPKIANFKAWAIVEASRSAKQRKP